MNSILWLTQLLTHNKIDGIVHQHLGGENMNNVDDNIEIYSSNYLMILELVGTLCEVNQVCLVKAILKQSKYRRQIVFERFRAMVINLEVIYSQDFSFVEAFELYNRVDKVNFLKSHIGLAPMDLIIWDQMKWN